MRAALRWLIRAVIKGWLILPAAIGWAFDDQERPLSYHWHCMTEGM